MLLKLFSQNTKLMSPAVLHKQFFLSFGATAPQWSMASSFMRFIDHTQRRSTVGRTPLDEWSARRRDVYLTTYNTHNRHTSKTPVGFEPTISAGERPQTHALDRAAIGTGISVFSIFLIKCIRLIFIFICDISLLWHYNIQNMYLVNTQIYLDNKSHVSQRATRLDIYRVFSNL